MTSSDRIDSTQFKIADLTSAGDMLLKREILVEGEAQVADTEERLIEVEFKSTEKGTDSFFSGCV